MENDVNSKSYLATWKAPFLAIMGVAPLELVDVSPANVGDVCGLLQAGGFVVGLILNKRAAWRYPVYSLPISALQIGVMSATAFF